MCECSATQSESNPRSSNAGASSVGVIEYSVKKIAAPISVSSPLYRIELPEPAGHWPASGISAPVSPSMRQETERPGAMPPVAKRKQPSGRACGLEMTRVREEV